MNKPLKLLKVLFISLNAISLILLSFQWWYNSKHPEAPLKYGAFGAVFGIVIVTVSILFAKQLIRNKAQK